MAVSVSSLRVSSSSFQASSLSWRVGICGQSYAVRVEAFGSDAYSLFETNSGPRETEDRDFDLDDRRRVGAEVAMLFVAVGALKWERNPLDEDVLVMTFPWAMYSCPCCRATSWTLNRNRRCLASILLAGAAVHLAQLVNLQSLPKEGVRCMTACADLHPRRLRGKCMVSCRRRLELASRAVGFRLRLTWPGLMRPALRG